MVRDAGIFKNILHMLVTRHQLILAYNLEMPSVFRLSIETRMITDLSVGILDVAISGAIRNKFKSLDSVPLTSTAYLNGTKYSQGMVLSVGYISGLPDFGRVLEIFLVDGHVFFITELFTAHFLEHLRCYQLTKKDHDCGHRS